MRNSSSSSRCGTWNSQGRGPGKQDPHGPVDSATQTIQVSLSNIGPECLRCNLGAPSWSGNPQVTGQGELIIHLWGGRVLYTSWWPFALMLQPLYIDLSRWKALTELRSMWSCICIMGLEAAVQLSIWLKVELAGDGQGWRFNIYLCNGKVHIAHHVNIMLQVATCCITCTVLYWPCQGETRRWDRGADRVFWSCLKFGLFCTSSTVMGAATG